MKPDREQKVPAFDLLHRKVQEELYSMRWEELRPIQTDAIREIIYSDKHLLIVAQTSGGKTEAAFLPILSQLLTQDVSGIFALYISPLKALINDQFRRLDDLCLRANIPVHKWHGDVGQTKKSNLVKDPKGVLLITPESVESLFINRTAELNKLFNGLQYIIIDEIHSFIGVERGAHLKSLISRIQEIRKNTIRLVGLSATIGDPQLACEWLLPRKPDQIQIINDEESEKDIKYKLHGYLRSNSEDESIDPADFQLAEDLLKHFGDKKALIFGNSKAKLEFFADLTRTNAEKRKLVSAFRIHHGSLSKVEREEAESDLRERNQMAVFCSSTLEMGIDVGDISIVGQIEPPWSVNSLIQRLGRSGRKDGQPSIMRMFVDEDETSADSSIVERLHCDLIQAVAMSELMLENWSEPPKKERLHYSTLVHQIMSLVKQHGGIRASLLFDILVNRGPFISISSGEFSDLLKSMGKKQLLEQIEDGDLILGLKGERIVNNFHFYAAFLSNEEIKIICKDKTIGTVVFNPSLVPDGYLILAGRRWKILEVNVERNEIYVEPSKGGKLPKFPSSRGPDIHQIVRDKMYQVLVDSIVPAYLDTTAQKTLESARTAAKDISLSRNQFLNQGENVVWFTWTSSKVNRTLMGLGKFLGKLNVEDDGVALTFNGCSSDKIQEVYKRFLINCPSEEDLAAYFPMLTQEKYDHFLPVNLQIKTFARNSLDLYSSLELIQEMVGKN